MLLFVLAGVLLLGSLFTSPQLPSVDSTLNVEAALLAMLGFATLAVVAALVWDSARALRVARSFSLFKKRHGRVCIGAGGRRGGARRRHTLSLASCECVCVFPCCPMPQAPRDASEFSPITGMAASSSGDSPSRLRRKTSQGFMNPNLDPNLIYRRDVAIKHVAIADFAHVAPNTILRAKVRIGCEKTSYLVPYVEDGHKFHPASLSLPCYRPEQDVLHFIFYKGDSKR